MTEFKNFTPHTINLNDGRSYQSVGVARVGASFSAISDDVCTQIFSEVEGLPPFEEGVLLIVSAMVLGASDRKDLVAPATGHPDCIRENGFIKSVPCFVR